MPVAVAVAAAAVVKNVDGSPSRKRTCDLFDCQSSVYRRADGQTDEYRIDPCCGMHSTMLATSRLHNAALYYVQCQAACMRDIPASL
jgi:hypothetical protein